MCFFELQNLRVSRGWFKSLVVTRSWTRRLQPPFLHKEKQKTATKAASLSQPEIPLEYADKKSNDYEKHLIHCQTNLLTDLVPIFRAMSMTKDVESFNLKAFAL